MNKLIAAVIILLLLLPGCWNRKEIEELAIVEAVGVDFLPENNNIKVTALIIRPGVVSGQRSGPAYFVLTGIGASFQDAVRKMASKSSRSIFFGQNEAFIFGEEMARQGIQMILDHFLRNPEIRFSNWVTVTEGSAAELLAEAQPQINQAVGSELRGLLPIEQTETALSRPQSIRQILADIASPGKDPLTAILSLTEEPKTAADKQEDSGGGGSQGSVMPGEQSGGEQEPQGQKQVLSLYGSAAFKGDRLTGVFNPAETRGVLWVLEETIRRTIVIDNPLPYAGTVTLLATGSSAEIKPIIENGTYRIEVKVKEKGDISEISSPFDFYNEQALITLETAAAVKIEEEVTAAFQRAQQLGTDVFGFGSYFYRSYPQQWKEEMEPHWEQIFSNELQLSVQADAKIRRTGFAGPPPPIQ